MTNDNGETDQDIAGDVLPETLDDTAVPVELGELFPWHRPRKQYIRHFQWVEYAKRLIGRLCDGHSLHTGPEGKNEIRYLTLPGTDYLDVRLISASCADKGCVLTSTGFLATETGNPLKARAEVRQDALIKAGHITDRSYTVWRRLEEVSSTASNAYRELRRRGPFHIVNIDACGSPAPPTAAHAQRMVDAIYRIVELQLSSSVSGWLMFVTVDVRNESVSAETLEKLTNAIRQNATESDAFRSGFMDLFGQEHATVDAAIGKISADDGEGFVRLFSLGLAKWMLHLALSKQWGLKMHSSYYYSTSDHPHHRPTMPCLAFEFVPPAPALADPFEVTNAEPAPGGPTGDFSLRALDKVKAMEDLDAKVAGDSELRHKLIDQTRELLSEAGYANAALAKLDGFAAVEAGGSSS